MAAIALLAAAVAGLILGHGRLRPVTVMLAAVAVGLLTGVIQPLAVAESLRPLVEPLAFLTVAVPLAILLDRIGFFDAAAERVAAHRRLRPSLWVFAAVVTTIFNLDTSIVLLTPLYIRIARRHGLDPLTTAYQPVLLASLASSLLPVSNLTNLIVASSTGADVGDFILRLGPGSVVAVTVGWWMFRRRALAGRSPVVITARVDTRALRIGIPIVIFLVVGFTFGAVIGVPAWVVAAMALVVVIPVAGGIPWRSIPVDAIAVAAGLALLATAVARVVPLEGLLSSAGPGGAVSALAAGVIGTGLVNNLPALLVGLDFVTPNTLWPFLAGLNFGPVLWIHGSLAGLLWLDIVRGHGFDVSPLDYARVGFAVGFPALLAAGAVVVTTGLFV
ncbi:MAG: SLC13 family permease [Acidimicrobiia bacterium]